jgi:AcrR family transcriptional regulator
MNCPFSSKPRWARRKEARPQELLAAALDVFVERGFAATRLGDVAALAGVSKGTLYLYFENKEELFKAVVRENLLPVLDEAEDTIDGYSGPSADLFREIMLGWWERIGATKLAGITKLMMAESGNFPELAAFHREEISKRGEAMIVRMLQRGIERGEFRAIDVGQTANVLMAPVIMLMMWQQPLNPCHVEAVDAASYLNSFIDLCLHGLLSQPDAGSK